MQDLTEQMKKRMKWRKTPEIENVAYEFSRLKHDFLDILLRLDDLEKKIQSSSRVISE